MTNTSKARLTDAKIRNAKPGTSPYKLPDGHGLFLAVNPTGAKCWRYRYRIAGRENLFAIGEYPEISLLAARAERERARTLVTQGIHPSAARRAQKLITTNQSATTFEAVAREWIESKQKNWSAYYLSQVENVMQADVFPEIGKLPIRAINAAHLLGILKRVEKRGAPNIAILIRQWSSAVFRMAVTSLRADNDPAAALKGTISKPATKHKNALTHSEIPILLSRIEEARSTPQIKIALQLLMLTFVRPSELREAPWSEFDLDRAIWEIPAERMKMRRPHIVPLSTQAVELLRRLKAIDGKNPLLFPNLRDPRRPMSPTTLNRCLERMKYGGYFSAHSFRANASTHLNGMGWEERVVDRQLAHQEQNKVKASYNHAEYLPMRIQMMQAWADFLDGVVAGNVTSGRFGAKAAGVSTGAS